MTTDLESGDARQVRASSQHKPSGNGDGRFNSALDQGEVRFKWPRFGILVAIHLLAMLAVLPWFFSWSALVLCLVGIYAFGALGINAGYHRLLSHRSFKCPKWVEYTLATLGACSMQYAPARWVAFHRVHHKYSDKEQDPHTPRAGFFWAHFEWILTNWWVPKDKFAPDMMRDRFYIALERNVLYLSLNFAHTLGYFVCGFTVGLLVSTGSVVGGLQLGASFVVWGVFVRTVWVWHGTWAINSLAHLSGYRNYNTNDQSRNNWVVALMNNGDGWHNNHHADPNCAAAGHRWWEVDVTYLSIRLLGLLGLASEIVPVRGHAERVYGTAGPRLNTIHADGSRIEVESQQDADTQYADAIAANHPEEKRAA